MSEPLDEGLEAGVGSEESSVPAPAPIDLTPINETLAKLADGQNKLTQLVGQLFEEEEEYQAPPQDMDLGSLTKGYVDQRMAPYEQYIRDYAAQQGERELNSLLDQHAQNLAKDFPDGFDKEAAKAASFYFFDQNPNDPEAAVANAARFAAEMRKNEREAALEGVKRAARPFEGDEGLEGSGGVAARPKFKSYDEVADHWAEQTEV